MDAEIAKPNIQNGYKIPEIDSIIIELMQSLDITKLNNPERDLENPMLDDIL